MSLTPPMTDRNWGYPPFNREGFLKVQELFPTARICRNADQVAEFPTASEDLLSLTYLSASGQERTVSWMLEETFTDAFLVTKRGVLLTEYYSGGMTKDTLHLANSITKSFTGMLAGIAVEEGKLDLEKPIVAYVPELGVSPAWAGTTTRHLLDMTAGVAYEEDYDDRVGDFWQETSVIGWRPELKTADVPDTLMEFAAARAAKAEPDGKRFLYKTLTTNVLGMVLERAFARPLQDCLSVYIWSRLGMRHDGAIVVDRARFPYVGAGLNACARDLARFGNLLNAFGMYQGTEVLPKAWVEETFKGGKTSKDEFTVGEFGRLMPGYHYRNQVWVTEGDSPAMAAIGIHGQYIYCHPATDIVIVKLSSQPAPLDLSMGSETFHAFERLVEVLGRS